MSAIPPLPVANVRSQTFYVARTNAGCWHCGMPTRVLALAMPDSHETLDAELKVEADDRCEPESDAWQRANFSAFLFYVEHLPGNVQDRLKQISPFFRPAYSAATLNTYWANHCEHCEALLGDHELHCEPDGAFVPAGEAAATNIELLQIRTPFEATAAGYAFEPEFFRSMQRI